MYFLVQLINFVLDTYLFLLLVRLLLQKLGAGWQNPMTQTIVKVTDPVVKPLRRFCPGVAGFDLAIVVAMIAFEWLETLLLLKIKVGVMPGLLGSLVVSLIYLGNKVISLYFWGTIVVVAMSWLPMIRHNPLAAIVSIIVEPLMKLGRRFVPLIGGIDLSAIPILLLLKIIENYLLYPILLHGYRLAY
jgi:YggT family protein